MSDLQKKMLKSFDAVGGFCISLGEMKKHPNYKIEDKDVMDIDVGMSVIEALIEGKNFRLTLQSPVTELECIIDIIVPLKEFKEKWGVVVDSKKKMIETYEKMIDPNGLCDND